MALLFTLGLFGQGDRAATPRQVTAPFGETLASVKMFVFGGFGRTGARSRAESAYDEVMSRPDRREILEGVFEAGTAEAKSYALVGIYKLDRARFNVLAAPFRSSKQPVTTGRGCIIGRTTLGAIIERIEAGAYARYV